MTSHTLKPTPPRLVATHKAEQNLAAVDPWTAVHLTAGLALGLMDVPLARALLGAVAYEALEQVFERHDAGRRLFRTSGPEVLHNVAVDVATFVVGHALGQAWNASGPASAARP